MKENISVKKSFEFAVRIVNLSKYLTKKKRNIFFQNGFYVVGQVLAQMFPKRNAVKARLILLQK